MADMSELIGGMKSKLLLEEEEDDGLEIGASGEEEMGEDRRWCMVGRLVTEREINFDTLKLTMSALWKPRFGVCFRELGEGRFLINFFHEVDLKNAIDGSPWTFEYQLLVWSKVTDGDDPMTIPLDEVPFWIQLHDIPKGLRKEVTCVAPGNYIGKLVECDDRNFTSANVKGIFRVRVSLNVTQPLKRRKKDRQPGVEWAWVNFRYERLPTFCFICGIIGHGKRHCPTAYNNPGVVMEKVLGPWLREDNRKTAAAPVNQWLRNEKGEGLAGPARAVGGGAGLSFA